MDGNEKRNKDYINKCGRIDHSLNNTASQFTAHSFILETSGLPIAAPFGFIPGLMLGLRKDDDDE